MLSLGFLNFDVTKRNIKAIEHFKLITDVLDRVDRLRVDKNYTRLNIPDRNQLMFSLEYANLSTNELIKLLSFDNGNFGHDVFGIDKYMSRETYQLTDCFSPRCTLSNDDSYRSDYKGAIA